MLFGAFHRALLTVFAAALGEFGTILDDFSYIEDQCEGLAPELAYHASVCLLVGYLVVMAVVLLNLLIAVLSTAHQEVSHKRAVDVLVEKYIASTFLFSEKTFRGSDTKDTVLSPPSQVYAKRRQEFFLARARLILQNAQAVVHRRIPVPFNLIQALFGIFFDLMAEIPRLYYNIIRWGIDSLAML